MEAIFGIALVMILAVGAVQVALSLYGRNAIISAAHEGARAGIELGRDPATASAIAERTVRASSGSLARDLDVDTIVDRSEDRVAIRVTVRARLEPTGPIPVSVPVAAIATVSRGRTP